MQLRKQKTRRTPTATVLEDGSFRKPIDGIMRRPADFNQTTNFADRRRFPFGNIAVTV